MRDTERPRRFLFVCNENSNRSQMTEPAFHRIYSTRALRSLLEQSGFDVIHADCFRVGAIWGMMHFISRQRARDSS